VLQKYDGMSFFPKYFGRFDLIRHNAQSNYNYYVNINMDIIRMMMMSGL
jgi:hypothetical protein